MESGAQPILNYSILDKVLEVSSYILLIGYWMMIITSYADLPNKIPIHFNALGKVDHYSIKNSIFLLPMIGSFLTVIFTFLSRNPSNAHFKLPPNAENPELQFRLMARMLRWVKLSILLVFILIDYRTILIAKGNAEGLGGLFLPFFLGIIFVPIGYFSFRLNTIK